MSLAKNPRTQEAMVRQLPQLFCGMLSVSTAQYFRFSSRMVAATGCLLLTIHDSVVSCLVQSLLQLLPAALGSRIQSAFPKWVLPTNICGSEERKGRLGYRVCLRDKDLR